MHQYQLPGPDFARYEHARAQRAGVSGRAAYQQLPPTQRQSTIIIMLTSAGLDRELEQLQRLPVAGVLAKPLTQEKLQGLLDQYFPA